MRVMVTGAGGFIGSAVCRALAARNIQFVGARRGQSATGVLNERRPDVVIHCAWSATTGGYLNALSNTDDAIATLTLARACSNLFTRFVGIGSCLEGLSETPYARTKSGLAQMLGAFGAWCRVHQPYGPGEHRSRLVPYVIERMKAGVPAEVSPGWQERDFMHVDDVGMAIVTVALTKEIGVVDIGTGVATPVRDVAKAVAEMGGGEVRYRDRDSVGEYVHRIVADVERLRGLGFVLRYTLTTGLRHTLEASYQ